MVMEFIKWLIILGVAVTLIWVCLKSIGATLIHSTRRAVTTYSHITVTVLLCGTLLWITYDWRHRPVVQSPQPCITKPEVMSEYVQD